MSNRKGPAHVVVDGSNIATEGRSMPSLAQLSEAVSSFMDEYPDTAITVVVDATFGHRIDKKEVPEFEAGISNNELVAPPAGAVGRGDAFVLGIAHKVGASILSNDSFQEFHGEYTWLFDEGRLIGGKPVPHIGWVWVDRVPVRGPISRKATRGSSGGGNSGRRGSGRGRRSNQDDESMVRTGSKEASAPMPKPKTPPPGRSTASPAAESTPAETKTQTAPPKKAPRGGDPANDLMPFLDFVEQHPIGTSVNGTVDAYSSHGAYITIADTGVRGYIPLRLMADPMPRSAKSIMKQGESVTVVVVSFAPARRSIDCAIPDMADEAIAAAAAEQDDADTAGDSTTEKPVSKRSTRKKSATRKDVGDTPQRSSTGAKRGPNETAVSKKASSKKAVAKKAVAKKAVAKKAVAKKAVAKKAAAKKVVAKQAVAKQAVAKKAAAKKVVATDSAATETPAGKAVPKKAVAVKAATKKTAAAKKAVAKKTAVAKKVVAKKAPARKSAAKKATGN
ncbi:MAG: histone H1-like repetitive region-containing protein [Ilumatobacter sp.]|uniref:histone H1-like repetitive region-containing protein n=1 Tax=Ilumatobacter sp. TaxID=1967498 RepID=UPI00329948D6